MGVTRRERIQDGLNERNKAGKFLVKANCYLDDTSTNTMKKLSFFCFFFGLVALSDLPITKEKID